jgi:hypothetical protein
MSVLRALQPFVITLAIIGVFAPSTMLGAEGPPRMRELRTQQVGETTYFQVRFDRPTDMAAHAVSAGPYSGLQRRRLGELPVLVSQDDRTSAVYHRLDLPHFRPTVGFNAEPSLPTPKGLEFVGKLKGNGKAKFLLLYPTDKRVVEGANDKEGVTALLRPAVWREEPVELDFGRAVRLPAPRNAGRQNNGPAELEKLWAAGQTARLAVLEALAPSDFGFYGFACAATGRKYGVPDPALEGERAREADERVHRRALELTTGTSAITQSLALKRMRRADFPDRGERTVNVATVPGIDIAEHPWKQMMGDKRSAPEPLAKLVPHDNYYVHFKSLSKLIELGDLVEQWGSGAARAYELNSRDYHVKKRYERQLCLKSTGLGRTLGPWVVRSVAITGSDPYLREGSDVTVLFHVSNRRLFLAGLEQFLKEARKEFNGRLEESKENYRGIPVESFVTPLREVSLHRAVFDDFVIYSNSAVGLRRVLDTHQGRHKSLWDSLDFQYMRTVFRSDEAEEDGFAFLSDAFIRQLVGPVSKIKELRRLEGLASLSMLTHGAMFTAWETGKLPSGHSELLDAARLRPEHIYVPEGKQIRWHAAHQVAVSDAYNTLHFATPLIELPLEKITPTEERAYRDFRTEYLRLWQQFFDPVGIRVALSDRQVRADIYILPLINNREYQNLRWWAGGGTLQFDPAKLSPRTLLQFTTHFNPNMRGSGAGNWFLMRLDDDVALDRLAKLWVRQEVDPQAPKSRDFGLLETLLTEGFTWDLPVTLGVAVGEERAFADSLKGLREAARSWLGPLKSEEKNYRNVPITRVRFDKDSQMLSFLNQRRTQEPLSSFRLYHARIDDAWYLGLSKTTLEELIDRAAARRRTKAPAKAETVPINASLYLSPRAVDKAADALSFYLEWETHKRTLPNNALWYALYRGGLVSDKTAEPDRNVAAQKFLGFVPASPDDSPYFFDSRTAEVVNRRHGSLRQPRFHGATDNGSPVVRLLEEFPWLRADMRFREDGLHTVLTIERNSRAGGQARR